jgi:hypothetical protein
MPLTEEIARMEKKSPFFQHNRGTVDHGQLSDPLQDPLLEANAERGIRAPGGPLPFADKISASFGDHDISGIRSHSGEDASGACRTMGARAYATGNHVAFSGAPDLHTAAHEAAHVVQQRAGVSLKGNVGQVGDAYEQQADKVADAVAAGRSAAHLLGPVKSGTAAEEGQVQHKLNGTAKAMEEAGGESGKYATKFGLSTYQNLLSKLRKYEDLEAGLVGKLLSEQDKDKLIKSLNEIESMAQKWLNNHSEIHDLPGISQDFVEITTQDTDKRINANNIRDKNIKANKHGFRDYDRAQQIGLLLPRLRLEKQDIASGRFERETTRSDKTEQKDRGQDGVIGGAVNTLDKVHYEGERDFSYFKEDRPDDFSTAAVITGSNIGRVGAKRGGPKNSWSRERVNFGGRSVASSRLDEKLSGDSGERLVAHTEFATHTRNGLHGQSKTLMGTSQKKAEGKTGAQVSLSGQLHQGESQRGGVDLTDPTLQRMLSNLQVLDAICGQLDRHTGNFLIDSDVEGRVKSVTGIDLDVSFTNDHKDIYAEQTVGHFKGLPVAIDKDFAKRVLSLTADDLTEILSPLLAGPEVEGARQRLRQVQDALRERQENNTLVEEWGKETAKSMLGDTDNYLASMRSVALLEALDLGCPANQIESGCYGKFVQKPVLDAFRVHPTSPPSFARNLALFAKDIAANDRSVLMAESVLKQDGQHDEYMNRLEEEKDTIKQSEKNRIYGHKLSELKSKEAKITEDRFPGAKKKYTSFYNVKWKWVGTQVQRALKMALTGDEFDPKWINFKFPSVSDPSAFLEFI